MRLPVRRPPPAGGATRRRNLLRDAMDVAAAEQDLARRHADHPPLAGTRAGARAAPPRRCAHRAAASRCRRWRCRSSRSCRPAAGRRAARGCRRRAATPAASRRVMCSGPGHRQLVHLQPPAARIARGLSRCDASLRHAVLRIAPVVGQCRHTTPGRTKQARLSMWPAVSSSTTPSPSQMTCRTPRYARSAARSGRGRARVAVGVQQALLGHEQRALAVDVDRAALVHERRAIAVQALDLEHLARHGIVVVPGAVRCPPQALKRQSTPRRTPRASTTNGGTDVAHPGIVARDLHHAHCAAAARRARTAHTGAELAPTVTGSKRAIAAATAANARCAGRAPSRQLSGRSGHSIQQPACGSNSAGIQKPSRAGVLAWVVGMICGRILARGFPRGPGQPSCASIRAFFPCQPEFSKTLMSTNPNPASPQPVIPAAGQKITIQQRQAQGARPADHPVHRG